MAQFKVIQTEGGDGHPNIIGASGKIYTFTRNSDGKLEALVDEGQDLDQFGQVPGYAIATGASASGAESKAASAKAEKAKAEAEKKAAGELAANAAGGGS